MMRVLIDTDICLDLVLGRKSFFADAECYLIQPC